MNFCTLNRPRGRDIMPNFAPWLHARALANPNEPDLQALKTFAEQSAGKWPYWSDDRLHYQKIIEDAAQPSDWRRQNTRLSRA